MPYLTGEQISELTHQSLVGSKLFVTRSESRMSYTLIEPLNHGEKSVIWRANDDMGSVVALKIVPEEEYFGHSLLDEMTEVGKLNSPHFARIIFFGSIDHQSGGLISKSKAIVTELIDGVEITEYLLEEALTVEDFVNISEQLFGALATLQNRKLCHDDLHSRNVLIQSVENELSGEKILSIKIIDTGTMKRISTRESLLSELRNKLTVLREQGITGSEKEKLESLLAWKVPDDHLRAVECLLYLANNLAAHFHYLKFWERRVFDQLDSYFRKLTDSDLASRLDSPSQVITELHAIVRSSKDEENRQPLRLASPFDYISAEMIRNDREFAELFSRECPWLEDCRALEPLYIYGPRGCGKSSVLRWLAFKTAFSDPRRGDERILREIGVYVSCSVELRSRFWLLDNSTIDRLQTQIVRFFNFLLLEELFDVLTTMANLENSGEHDFGLSGANVSEFTQWFRRRLNPAGAFANPRLQGQSHFEYIRGLVRKQRWKTWSSIQVGQTEAGVPDPSLVSDVCRMLSEYFSYFNSRHVTFLIDDYSNQRIPPHLQIKLNQTISFAKQGTPLFKVSSEYQGVDLSGIQEGREVVEVNVSQKYTELQSGSQFLVDIVNIRLKKAQYISSIEDLLGPTLFEGDLTLPEALVAEAEGNADKFHYHGIDCIHWLCSGDVALALDLIKRIYDENSIGPNSKTKIAESSQHKTIQAFSHNELRRIKHIVPYGEEMHDIVAYLGYVARIFVTNKKMQKKDRLGEPVCKTHVDIRIPVINELRQSADQKLADIYKMLTSRAILITLETSRSRISGTTERLQMRRIYFPAFKAPLKRDQPIKIDNLQELISLLSNPKTFAERELNKSNLATEQLELAIKQGDVKPRDN